MRARCAFLCARDSHHGTAGKLFVVKGCDSFSRPGTRLGTRPFALPVALRGKYDFWKELMNHAVTASSCSTIGDYKMSQEQRDSISSSYLFDATTSILGVFWMLGERGLRPGTRIVF